jgi:hypothetical protein
MTRHYGHPIQVEVEQGAPRRFIWRGQTYRIRAVWATWHLRDRWWVSGEEAGAVGTLPASDRHYSRVSCTNGLQCDLYYDAAAGTWILDRVHD